MLSAELDTIDAWHVEDQTYHNGPLPPSTIPMPAYETQPISLAPYAGAHADLRVQLDTHLEVSLQLRHRDGIAMAHGARALECGIHNHCIVITLLWSLGGGGGYGRPIDGFMQDRVVRIMLLHRREVVGAF